jgi:uncharacterized protein (TIGR02453 family)
VTFEGFRPQAFRFLRGIARNNNRAWFEQHRSDYERYLLEPAKDLVEALGGRLRRLSKDVQFEPRVNGSIRRINRDIRFSPDKRPYKDHLDLWFWQGKGQMGEAPGYWFRLRADTLLLGAGLHEFSSATLERYRAAVVDETRGRALQRALTKTLRAGYELGGRRYKRVPSGFDPGHPRAELLLHNAIHVGVETPLPPEVATPDFPAFCFDRYRGMSPVQNWLAALIA